MLSRKTFFSAFTLFILAISLLLPQPASVSAAPAHVPGGIVFVKSDAAGANNGTSWANAYTALQTGINAASSGEQVWVAAGTYSPGDAATDSFVMKAGVKIYGGFAGTTETALSQRNWQSNVTTLSGGSVNYHVIFNNNNGLTSAAVLDGFSITGGNANGSYPHDSGGGMYNFYASPTLTNVAFSGNSATGGYGGGGMYNYASSPTLTNVTFSGNATTIDGGGMFNDSSSPTLTNVTFSGNTATGGCGGGMYNGVDGSPTLTNVTFSGNTAYYGGGMFNGTSTPTLTNVTFSGNSASHGGGMYNDNGSPTLRNSILWGNLRGNTPDQISGVSATISYSDVQGGYAGTGNINVDPLFGDVANGDLRLQAASPAKNAGDNALLPADMLDLDGDGNTSEAIPFDLAGNPRVVNGTVDMGAYENQAIYVDDSATGGANNGSSWANAYTALQTGINAASSGEQVWVAAGSYSPGAGAADSFVMKAGVKIYGGFAGTTETALSQRNWRSNVTTLSGGGVNYHVIFNNYTSGSPLTSAAVLDGFSITGGNANSSSYPHNTGGGMFNSNASPKLTNVTFSGNSATIGGGMFNVSSSPTLTNVTFSGNATTIDGGGMYNEASSPTLTNVTFSGNSAYYGGGMFNYSSSPTLTNVTFSGNSASHGGGMYNDSGSPTLRNSILWGNTPDQISGVSATISYSDVQGGYAGTGNINDAPLFVRAPSAGVDGIWGTMDDDYGNLRLQAASPARNAGDNALLPADMLDLDGDGNTSEAIPFDLAGNPRVFNGAVDMGAYENQPIYVDDSATGGANNGTSWANAYTALQTGINAASSGEQVWVAAGTYSPGAAAADSFVMKAGVKIYGGFAGTTETALSQRNWQSNVTTLSGGGVNYHVIYNNNNGLTSAAVLDGFSITGGNANSSSYPHNTGGGMFNYSSSPTLTNVTFSGNSAGYGGGMYNFSSSPTLTNVTFSGNTATSGGGGMYNEASSPTLTNVTFSGNTAANYGGGMYNGAASSPTVRNSILWGNTPDQISGAATISYSDVQGGYDGTGNINDDPLFVDVANGDLRLQAASPAINRGDPATAGLPDADLAGNPRVVDGAVDMGAYENQAPNHAPLLSGVYSLTALAEDPDPSANPGGLISTFLTGAGVSDADGNPLGIAIIGADNAHGQWQYSPNGATWMNISGVSDTGALLLARSNSLRFMPNPDWNGATTLTLRAWDGADGRASGASGIDVSVNGFFTAFSAASAELSQAVSAVNDAPVNTTAPVISGTATVSVLLTASTGDWNDTKDQDSATFQYAYQWQIADDGAGTNAADINGATNPTYTPTQAKWVRVTVTATDNGVPGSASGSAFSAWVQVASPHYYIFLPLLTKH